MQETTRREFLLTMEAFAVLPPERTKPEVILYNGNFWTVNPRAPRAEAAALSDGRFVAIEPGKLADLVVLGRDPFKEDPANLVNIPVERTMSGGKWVYES